VPAPRVALLGVYLSHVPRLPAPRGSLLGRLFAARGRRVEDGDAAAAAAAARLTLQLWDVSGASARRPLWRHFFTGTQGVVFVVDASDGARMALAAAELRAAAADEQLAGAAFVVAVTHGDAPGAAPLADVGAALAVEAACAGHAWALLPVNGATGAGLDAVWDFLCEKTRRL
jgi:hypothetical protein